METETETTPEVTEPEVPETEAPALTKEAIAEFLGVDVASLDRVKNLDAMAREVMRDKSEFGRVKAAAPAAHIPSPDDDVDLSTIDPATRKILDKLIEQTVFQRFGESLSLPAVQAEEDVNSAIEEFLGAHNDLTPEAIAAVISELEAQNVRPIRRTKRATKEYLKVAYDIAKSRTMDTDAMEKAAYEKALAKIAADAADKGDVVAVEKKRGTSEKVDADVANAEKGFWERTFGN